MSVDETDARLARLDWSRSSVWRWSTRLRKPACACRRCA
jgi:L-ribulose-5-phosphate 3-epimerase UlaE